MIKQRLEKMKISKKKHALPDIHSLPLSILRRPRLRPLTVDRDSLQGMATSSRVAVPRPSSCPPSLTSASPTGPDTASQSLAHVALSPRGPRAPAVLPSYCAHRLSRAIKAKPAPPLPLLTHLLFFPNHRNHLTHRHSEPQSQTSSEQRDSGLCSFSPNSGRRRR